MDKDIVHRAAVPVEGGFELCGCADHHDFPQVHDRHPVAQAIGFVHEMGGRTIRSCRNRLAIFDVTATRCVAPTGPTQGLARREKASAAGATGLRAISRRLIIPPE